MEFILYVADQARSKQFYEQVLGKSPVLDVPGMTEFQLNAETKLGLMPEQGIQKILNGRTPHPATGSGIPRCELYLPATDPEASLKRAVEAGAVLIDAVCERNWGDCVGYCSDPDGHVLAFFSRSTN